MDILEGELRPQDLFFLRVGRQFLYSTDTDVAKHSKEDERDAQKISREWTEECASG